MEKDSKRSDVVIVGGGPGGMSTALWCADLGLEPVVIEENTKLGGQLLWTHNPTNNYLGLQPKNGDELASKFAKHIEDTGIKVMLGTPVTSVDFAAKSIVAGGQIYIGRAIVVASGVRRRQLGISGEDEFGGRGILVSGARDRESARDKTVVIVGGGDAALENASMLAEVARKVYVIHRRDEFAARDEFVSRASERSNVEFVLGASPTEIGGGEYVEYVLVREPTGNTARIECDAVLIRIGVDPNTDLFGDQVKLDDRGFIVVDKQLRTSIPGVWAIGDVASPDAMTIANAVGAGSVAAKSIVASR